MKSIFSILSAFLVLLATIVLGTEENKREFEAMCKLYGLLITKPEGIEVQLGDTREDPSTVVQGIMEEIELFKLATTPTNVYELIREKDKKEGSGNSVPEFKEISEEQWKKWHEKLKQVPKDPSENTRGNAKYSPRESEFKSRAHALIRKIQAQAEDVKVKIDVLERQAKNDLGEARKHMLKAIFGTQTVDDKWGTGEGKLNENSDWSTLTPPASSFASGTAYDTGCKTTGTEAGKSMVNDLCCICGKNSGGNNEQYCDTQITGLSSKSAANYQTGSSDGPARWAAVKPVCEQPSKPKNPNVVTPDSLLHAIHNFKNLLNTNWGVNSGMPTGTTAGNYFILGRFVYAASNAPECSGTAVDSGNSVGVCVSYKTAIKNHGEIPWVSEVLQAIQLLRKVDFAKTKIQALLSQLEADEHKAELTYHEAILDIPNAATPGQNTNGTGNALRQDVSGKNPAAIPTDTLPSNATASVSVSLSKLLAMISAFVQW